MSLLLLLFCIVAPIPEDIGTGVERGQARLQLVGSVVGAFQWWRSYFEERTLFSSRGDTVFKFRFRDYSFPCPDYYHRRHRYRRLPKVMRLRWPLGGYLNRCLPEAVRERWWFGQWLYNLSYRVKMTGRAHHWRYPRHLWLRRRIERRSGYVKQIHWSRMPEWVDLDDRSTMEQVDDHWNDIIREPDCIFGPGKLDAFIDSIDPLQYFELASRDLRHTTSVKMKGKPSFPCDPKVTVDLKPIKRVPRSRRSGARAVLRPRRVHCHHFSLVKRRACVAAIQLREGARFLSSSACKSSVIGKEKELAPVIVDTGASITLTPCRGDFIEFEQCQQSLSTVDSTCKVAGRGIICWTLTDATGNAVQMEMPALYVPSSDVRLMSPQSALQALNDGQREQHRKNNFYGDEEKLVLQIHSRSCFKEEGQFHELTLPYNRFNNLPMIYDVRNEKTRIRFNLAVSMRDLDEYQATLNVCERANGNLSPPQKELKLWHDRLVHADQLRVQQLFKMQVFTDSTEKPVLPSKFKSTKSPYHTPPCKCAACEIAKAKRQPQGRRVHDAVDMKLKQGDLRPGDCVSTDQYESRFGGRLGHTFGKEKKEMKYTGGTIFVDHASGYIKVVNQVSLRGHETISGKQAFEREAHLYGVTVKHYRSDNGIFASDLVKKHCDARNQTYDFSGTGAHHQNAVAERAIGTVTRYARAILIHAAIYWPEQVAPELWPQAIEYAVWVYNRLPRSHGYSPLEIFAQTKMDHEELRRAKVWGCPVYVLEPKLQDGKKVPKWAKRARRGRFVGFSSRHSSVVGMILNLSTGKISPQYHVVYDELFQTVPSLETGVDPRNHLTDEDFLDLFQNRERYYDEDDVDDDGNPIEPPPLPDEWLDDDELREREENRQLRQRQRQADNWLGRGRDREQTGSQAPEGATEGLQVPEGDDDGVVLPQDVEEDPPSVQQPPGPPPPPEPPPSPQDRPRSRAGRPYREGWKRGRHQGHDYQRMGKFAQDSEDSGSVGACMMAARPPAGIRNKKGVFGRFQHHPKQQIRKEKLTQGMIASLDWSTVVDSLGTGELGAFSAAMQDSRVDDEVEEFDPRILAAKIAHDNNDTPNWNQAMNGPYSEEYWEAAQVEIDTLERQMKAWDVVPRTDDMNVLGSTWAFKCKRFPDGSVRKFKGRFCVRGDQQIEGVDFTETYSPVVQWSTIRVMEVLSLILDLKTAQADVTAAFLHAPLDEGENVYVQMPRGFSKPGHVLKLRRSLYGLRQSPRNFGRYMKSKLESIGIMQSELDECLFVGRKVVLVTWVDDVLLYSPKDEWINETIAELREAGIDISRESDTAGFLGVDIKRGTTSIDDEHRPSIEMTQTGLIDRIVTALGLDDAECGSCHTPADSVLGKCEDADRFDDNYNYASVVGMMLYLAGHTRPDITFAVHQCARFSFGPRHPHGVALKRIGKYLKNTRDKGIILNPSKEIKIDAYPDADFAGLWGHEDSQDPVCVKSRTGFVICVADCPVVWASKLQTEISTSTMEAEYVALGTCCRSLFPIIRTVKGIAEAINLDAKEVTEMHVQLHEDNAGALTLAKLEYPRMTPRTKWYAVKYHWFRTMLAPNKVELRKIDTKIQKGDLFTKPFARLRFEELRKLVLGW